MLEYVLALAGLLMVIVALWALVRVTVKYANRTESLVSSEYP